MMKSERFLFKYKWVFILLPVVVALAMLLPLRKASINPDLNTYLPESMPAKKALAKLEAVFGKYEPVLLFLECEDALQASTLERIKSLSKGLNRMSEFDQVLSLFDASNIKGAEGAMVVEPVIERIPETEVQRAQLREDIRGNELAYGLVVSEDFRYAMILVNPAKGVDDDQAIALLESLLEKYPGPEKAYMNGAPYLKHEIQARTTKDLAILLPIGLLLMILFLYFSFREIRGVVLPLSVVVLSIVLSMGLMPLFGWEFSLMAVLVPIMMIAIANNYGVHIISRYQELNAAHPDWSSKEIVNRAVSHLTMPVLFTGLTTIVGVLGMVVTVMIPAQQMGLASALGVAFALVLSLTFIPAVLAGMKKGPVQPSFTRERHTQIDRILAWVGKVTTTRPGLVVGVFAVTLVVLGMGIFRLQVSINHENMMPKGHALRVSTQIANDHFGGTKNIAVLFEGDLKDPALLQRMDQYGRELEQIPAVGRVVSLASVLRKMSQAMNDPGSAGYDQIPESRDAVAQYLELYAMSGDPSDFEKLVDFDYTKGVMNIQFQARDVRSFDQVTGKVQALTKGDPQVKLIGGHSLVERDLALSIIRSQVYSLVFAAIAIGLLLIIIFRSAAGGLIGSLPLAFALLCNFGLMGWLGIKLDIASSMLSSIAIGIGVDYTIHLFWRLQAELREGKAVADAIKTTLRTTGRGIAINAFSVMLGFSVLFLSGLILLKTFAFLIIFSLLLCLFSALALIPALSLLIRPAFLLPKITDKPKSSLIFKFFRGQSVAKR